MQAYSLFANMLARTMYLKSQELLVLLKVAAHPTRRFTFATLAAELSMSAAEVHGSVRRATAAGLVSRRGRGDWKPVRSALLEFVLHGARYAFPAEIGPRERGIPMVRGAESLLGLSQGQSADVLVWAHPQGAVLGPTVSPIYRTAPQAALADPALHHLLALLDAQRVGMVLDHRLSARAFTDAIQSFDAEA